MGAGAVGAGVGEMLGLGRTVMGGGMFSTEIPAVAV